ncbi:LAETG motif-containing sortase-dependent surface protein [Streptomyces sp. NPDC058008]|uniref:LAETG motif-containing sortase-dependent surface protein n=1 Tax=Streptomyces sp. NPDC058008 TaxID=3346303 RepID=UPI0036E6CDFD
MKLRRTLALAAATAVVGPVVLLSAPAAFADTRTTTTESPSATPSETLEETPTATATAEETESVSPSPTVTPSATESTEGTTPETTAPTPTGTPVKTPSATPEPTASETADEDDDEDEGQPLDECEPRPLELSIKGLSGKIARGGGWDRFTFNIYNDSKSTVKNVAFFAGAAADKAGEKLFSTDQVRLQALNDGVWEDVEDFGSTSGYVGQTDEIKPGYEIDIDLRLKVAASAPVGAGFSLGGGLVFGEDFETEPCFTDVAYKFQIVDAGAGGGAKPQEGGKIPVPAAKPAGDTSKVTGSLAETGSSSTTPAIALAGGAAVVLGAGAMFVVRRRKNGEAAG